MCDNTNTTTQSIADYLSQLLKDRKQLAAFPNVFIHVERLLDEEIAKVRASLFQISGVKKEPLVLPEPEGEITTLTEKVYVPVKEHPDFNFVGRILGPRGMTAKQLEQETGCKIMVRGKGSMRDKKKEEQNRGKPNWEHLTDELHVLLTVDDTENRATLKLARAVEEVKKLLVPVADGEDELKKRQLMELAIINGTYRDSNTKVAAATACDEEWRRVAAAAAETQRLLPGLATPMRTPSAPLGAPLILSPRISVPTTAASLLNGSGPPGSLLSAGDPHGLIYTPYADYANYAALAASPLLTDYTTADHSAVTCPAERTGKLLMIVHPEKLYTFVCWGQVQQPLPNNVGTWVRYASTLIKGLVLCRESGVHNCNTVRTSAKRLGVLTMETTRLVLTPGLWNNIRVRSVHQPDDHLRRSHHQPCCCSSTLSILYPPRVFKLYRFV